MLHFEMDVAAADLVERTIEGVIVPYGEVATINGRKYRFLQGSARRARARTPLLVDHNRGEPVGVLAELADTGRGALGRFRVDQTSSGDTALVQAASGSRGSLSVGAELVSFREEVDGVIDVVEAAIHEVSLLALGAFEGATVTRVAAELAEPPKRPDGDQQEEGEEPEADDAGDDAGGDDDDPEEGSTMTEASAAAPVIIAGADRPTRELIAGELVALIIRAQHGEPDARRFLEAALTESISTDVSGLLPPTYERTVLGGKITPRPLYGAFSSRPLPGVGLMVNKPVWTTPPDGQWAATVDDDAHTTKVVVGAQSATVLRWDWAGAIPWVVVQRSDPSIIDEIYAEAVQDWYYDVEAKIYGEVGAAAPGTSTTLGAGIAEFWVASKRSPDVIIVAPDLWGTLADANALNVAVASGAVSASNELRTTYAGIPIVASGALAAGEAILATRRAVDARVTDPVRLTANAIGALNVELAVVGEGLFDTDYPAELLKLSAVTPASALASSKTTKA
jgi:HK97 family phage prohead protease